MRERLLARVGFEFGDLLVQPFSGVDARDFGSGDKCRSASESICSWLGTITRPFQRYMSCGFKLLQQVLDEVAHGIDPSVL